MPDIGRPRPRDIAEALALLTRLPVSVIPPMRGAAAAWAWPLAGAAVGLLGALTAWAAMGLGLGAQVAAALALGMQALATGALHEDGLADCADGFWGGTTRERRLAIMSDSRIGSYGALGLILVILLRWSALTVLIRAGAEWEALIAAGALSRWPMAALLWALPPARADGLSRLVGRPDNRALALGGGIALALALVATGSGSAGLGAALAAAVVAGVWILLVRARLGGQTGDTCGAVQQLSETAVLLTLLAGI
ncbi:cobalamin-5'-phosphate synthase [Rubellimicrobium thermophilum DSM 16684]|uniref:Adenosylcobinamide-GDP ribazoletransferase n=1 Tax=Rubellimicrobium thermophilum DSM 16684 TaxID=1123069 RepID=S9SJH8_9RHOB|nr:adenosylcobinamide-GDP ribazoletransferase [Rubellimicrobium thermophilum]EPX86499.1 cobalamin-5'-phosphate synthase [Rubellimicrobium thermophilum DSM 16684]